MALTDAQIKAAQARPKRWRLSDAQGLLLEVDPSGAKYWLWRHRYPPSKTGKQQDLRIGPYPKITLKQARQIRDEQKAKIYEGVNPCLDKKQKKTLLFSPPTAITFEAVATDWHRVRSQGKWSPIHSKEVIAKLRRDVFPAIGQRPVQEVRAQDCVAVLRSIEKRGALETAKRTLGIIGQVMDYAIANGYTTTNPAQPLKGQAPVKQVIEHYPCVEWSEVGRLLRTIEANPCRAETVSLHALRLLALTFVRTSELIKARWEEVDFAQKMWQIPAERMKGNRGKRVHHLVPLSKQAIEVFQAQHKISGPDGLIFKSTRSKIGSISNNTVNMVLKRMGYDGKMSGHGFRTLAMTNIREQLKIDIRVIDKQLAHVERNKVLDAYNRAGYIDERIPMMQRWADLLDLRKETP